MSESQTLLLTDVVDSTCLNETLGDAAMGPLWQAHDGVARQLMATWHGREIARSDGFLVLFESVGDGVGFATAYHAALRSLDSRLTARVGIHVGPVSLRENSELDRLRGAPLVEVDGVALPITARVMATGTGGQTLLTESAVAALGPSSMRVKSHGHWRLKGVGEPIELFEIGDEHSAFEPPPDSAKSYRVVRVAGEWAPARKIPNNLPAERDSFIGRADPLGTLEDLLDSRTRLVTLLGIGGIGKTRLAVRYARTWLGHYPGGAWFCDLSTARDLQGIFSAVANVLDVQLGKGDPAEQICTTLAARGACLLILDNFEQVARHAEAALGVWLEHAPQAKFIATSREVLGIAGEQAQVLAPLTAAEGTELFTRRAAAAAQQFAATLVNMPTVAALVDLLDGLPLAIELAAARSRVLSPTMLLGRMKERFTLLAARGGRQDRQMTMRSTLDWSWDLLPAAERAALAQLSVFEGGFTLDAFEAVFHFDGEVSPSTPLDLLQSLSDKSLVRQVGGDRFDLLQTVQEYASEHLRAEGRFLGSGLEAAQDAERRHGEFFAALTEAHVTGSRCVELGNLAAACRRASGRGDHAAAVQTLALAWAAVELRGPFKLGLDLALSVLAMPGLPSASRPEYVRGAALYAIGRMQEAGTAFDVALAASREAGDPSREAEVLIGLGALTANAGRTDEARAHLSAALALARSSNASALECAALNNLGSLNERLGRTEAAARDYEAALALARRVKDRRWEGGVLGNLGMVQMVQGRVAEASASYEAGLALARELGHKKWEGNALCNLGLVRQLQGDTESAREYLASSLQLAREMGHARLQAFVLCNLGITEESASNLEAAQEHLDAALAVAVELADRRTQGQILGYLGLLHCKRGRAEEGRRMIDAGKAHVEAIANESDLALLLCQSAEAHFLHQDPESARAELARARSLAGQPAGAAGTSELKSALDRVARIMSQEAIGAT